MRCDHFDAGTCRSCALMGVRYAGQLADKEDRARQVLAGAAPDVAWLAPGSSAESGFRNKAKLVAGGTPYEPVLGILDQDKRVVDLTDCGLYEPGLAAALPLLKDLVADLRLLPYDVRKARGELKHLVVTCSPDAELAVRFVLRSERQLGRTADAVADLPRRIPQVRVVTANFQPDHKAVIDGETEVQLSGERFLPMRLPRATLLLRARSFFQTNTAVAAALYAQAGAWVDELAPRRLVDLYCGVGGFALHALSPTRDVLGVELSDEAVECATAAYTGSDLRQRGPARFVVGDATRYVVDDTPDLVVVNPPRRGIGAALCETLEHSTVPAVLYSSCNPATLALDLARMPSYRATHARLFDMFPQTEHAEVLVRLERQPGR